MLSGIQSILYEYPEFQKAIPRELSPHLSSTKAEESWGVLICQVP